MNIAHLVKVAGAILSVLIFLPIPTAVSAKEIVYATPGFEEVGWWEDEKKYSSDGRLVDLVRSFGARNEEVEIRLLTLGKTPWQITDYYGPIIFSSKSNSGKWLKIVGPRRKDELFARIVGKPTASGKPRTLKESVCSVLKNHTKRERCYRGEPSPNMQSLSRDKEEDILDVIAELGISLKNFHDAQVGEVGESLDYHLLSIGAQQRRINCFSIIKSSHIKLENLIFHDCWLPAVMVMDSSWIDFIGNQIQGSSYAFVLMSTKNKPESVRHFKISENVFVQSPARYKNPDPNCNIRWDLDCPADIWSEIPWGVTHDRFWEVLNGGLVGGFNVGGDIDFENNTVSHAYNGIRIKASANCTGRKTCWEKYSRNVSIRGNRFEYIRDNPVEPERYASNWVIAQNEFKNSYAWISLDGVKGDNVYVFGNTGWFEDGGDGNRSAGAPSLDCENTGWHESPLYRFRANLNEEGYEIPVDEFDPECFTHSGGRVLKVKVSDEDLTDGAYLERIYVFNNSWYIRSPVIGVKRSPTTIHWNNAIHFAGCGFHGDPACRTHPWHCEGSYRNYYTADSNSIFAACFNFDPPPGSRKHEFDFNAYSGEIPPILKRLGLEASGLELNGSKMFMNPQSGDFTPTSSSLKRAKCRVVVQGSSLICDPTDPDLPYIGSIQADGNPFDFQLP